jgi:hypothetical protein
VIDVHPAHEVPEPTFRSYPQDRLCRGGLWLGALGAALCIFPGFGSESVADQGSTSIVFDKAVYLVVGGIFFVVLVLAATLPHAWARLSGIGVMGAAAFVYGVIVTVARVDPQFEVGPSVTLGSSGIMLTVAYIATCIGLILALVGAPRIGRPAVLNNLLEPIQTTSSYAITSMVLSICGLMVLFTAPLGIAFAVAAFHDHERSKGYRGGRGMAIAGLVIGIVIVAFGALFMTILIGFSDPSFNDTTTTPLGVPGIA